MNKKIRKLDYFIVFIITFLFLLINLINTKAILGTVLVNLIISVISSLIVGTITNFVFKKKDNRP